jgi:hypothetical protein
MFCRKATPKIGEHCPGTQLPSVVTVQQPGTRRPWQLSGQTAWRHRSELSSFVLPLQLVISWFYLSKVIVSELCVRAAFGTVSQFGVCFYSTTLRLHSVSKRTATTSAYYLHQTEKEVAVIIRKTNRHYINLHSIEAKFHSMLSVLKTEIHPNNTWDLWFSKLKLWGLLGCEAVQPG